MAPEFPTLGMARPFGEAAQGVKLAGRFSVNLIAGMGVWVTSIVPNIPVRSEERPITAFGPSHRSIDTLETSDVGAGYCSLAGRSFDTRSRDRWISSSFLDLVAC